MDAARQIDLAHRLAGIIDKLQKEADDRVSKRQPTEKRWIEDLQQYHAVYDSSVVIGPNQSKIFMNETRPKTNAVAARLSDMLFPTDDKNWGIKPTPVPDLVRAAKAPYEEIPQTIGRANAMLRQGGAAAAQAMADQVNARMQQANDAQQTMAEAKGRAEAMELELEDQLRECGYNIEARRVIEDACRVGIGVMKGPVIDRVRQRWNRGQNGWSLEVVQNRKPGYYRVDYWSYFPDPEATRPEESEGDFERHVMSGKDLRKLARQPGFDRNAIERLLRSGPQRETPDYFVKLRDVMGLRVDTSAKRYHGWEFRGPMAEDDLRALYEALGRGEELNDLDLSPLEEVHVCVWFCQGELLKLALHPLDSGDTIYSVFCLERDDSSIFGIGIPRIMRNSQAALNGAWRMMMDNGGLSSGPQIVIDQQAIEPADGTWDLKPRKIWLRKKDVPRESPPFETYEISSHQAELANIITAAMQFIDEETGVPKIAQGDQGASPTETLGGMTILMNSANVVFRRWVKNFDDDLTVPCITRGYHFNMQFSEKEEIKGDFEVDARGSSVLLVREMQAQNLIPLVERWSVHPLLGPMVKLGPAARKAIQSMMLAADDLLKTDQEIAREQAEAAAQGGQPDLEMQKLEVQFQIAEIRAQTDLQVAKLNHQTAMMTLAEQRNMTVEDLRTKLEIKDREIESKERIMAAEVAVQNRQRAQDRALPPADRRKGGGGYV
jgi:hypothetical protein